MTTRRIAPTLPLEAQFPHAGQLSEKLRFLLNYAILSPSSHNTQPWQFKIVDDRIELYADRTRALPIADPDNRELILSCGAALFHLRLAFRHFGYQSAVDLFPQGDDPDLLAWIGFGAPDPITPEEEQQFWAIAHRHTHRSSFADQAVPDTLLAAFQQVVAREGAKLVWLKEAEMRTVVAEMIARGDRLQASNPDYREELSAWIRPNYSHHHDGIPGYAFGMNSFASQMMPTFLKQFDWGRGIASRDQQLALDAPVLAVLTTTSDTPRAWLAGGQALASLLLFACSQEIGASFLNQPIQQPSLRAELRELLRINALIHRPTPEQGVHPSYPLVLTTEYPQLLVRMGYSSDLKATPRRTVGEVLVDP